MQHIKNILKCLLAGIVAVAILSILLVPYSLLPVHINNPEGNTDYVWPANSRWSKMTEGISYGKFDARGYNNAKVIENPDILVLGSSHTEGTNVLPTETFAALLGQKLEDKYTVYNQGISSHHFTKVCKYLPKNIELNPDAKYIIIETSTVKLEKKQADALLGGKVDFTPSNSSSLIGTMQRIPFPRTVYQQYANGLLDLFIPSKSNAPENTSTVTLPEESAYDDIFGYIQDAMQNTDAKLIIVYHPTGVLQEDGSASFQVNDAARAMFSSKCQQYGISFVDMTQSFAHMYTTEHKLPHGFITGKIGDGHLNAAGHGKIAEELAKRILALEEAE